MTWLHTCPICGGDHHQDDHRDPTEFPVQIELREHTGDGHLPTGVTWEVADSEGPLESGHVTGDPRLREVWMAALGNAHAALATYDRELADSNRAVDEYQATSDRRRDERLGTDPTGSGY